MFNFNIGIDNFSTADQNVLFVCAMGLGTVFVGLILLIFVCKVMGLFVGSKSNESSAPVLKPITPVAEKPIENKQELIAAISVALAEELGTDVSGIRIHSIKKL